MELGQQEISVHQRVPIMDEHEQSQQVNLDAGDEPLETQPNQDHSDAASSNLSPAPSDASPPPSDSVQKPRQHPWIISRLAVRYTAYMLTFAIGFPLICMLIIALTGSFYLAEQTTNDYLVYFNTVVQQAVALDSAIEAIASEDAQITQRTQKKSEWQIYLLYRAKLGSNLLTPTNLAYIKKLEDEFRFSFQGYGNFCYYDQSFVNCKGQVPSCALPYTIDLDPYFYGMYDSSGNACDLSNDTSVLTASQVDMGVQDMFLPNSTSINPRYMQFLGAGFSYTNKSSEYLRSLFVTGGPLAGFSNINTDSVTQDDLFREYVKAVVSWTEQKSTENDQVEVIVFNINYQNYLFNKRANESFVWAIGSVLCVWFLICVHTKSVFLGTMAMIQILLSFPVAYFLYYFVFRITYFSSMHILSIFLIVGIGADDVFVYLDAFHQSDVQLAHLAEKELLESLQTQQQQPQEGLASTDSGSRSEDPENQGDSQDPLGIELEDQTAKPQLLKVDLLTKIDFAYRRSLVSMFVASFTTFASFLISALTSSIMPIQTFGYFAAILIMSQYVWCLLMFPCSVRIWEVAFRHRHWRNCLRLVDEQTSYQMHQNDKIRLKALGARLSQWLCWRKPKVKEEQKAEEAGEGVNLQGDPNGQLGTSDAVVSAKPTHIKPKYRAVERFFRYFWCRYTFKLRYLHTLIACASVGVAIWLATRLEPLEEEEVWLPDDHIDMKPVNWMEDEFLITGSQDSYTRVSVVYGVSGIDLSTVVKYDPSVLPDVVWDTTFSLNTAEAQQALMDNCNAIIARGDLVNTNANDPWSCWILDFHDFQTYISNGTSGFVTYNTDQDLLAAVLNFVNYENAEGSRPYIKYLDSGQLGIINDDPGNSRLAFCFFEFQTNVSSFLPYSQMYPIVQDWQRAVAEITTENPAGADYAYPTGGTDWSWIITQNSLLTSAFQGIGYGLLVGFLSLVGCTMNLWIALYSIFAVGGIVSFILGTMYLLGWQFGIIESVSTQIIPGFSIDYTVHIAMSYRDAGDEFEHRYERTQSALTDLGISVLFGALTSLVSGAFLFGPELLFFPKFGTLLMITIAFSLLFSLLFLVSLLHLIGPRNKCGDLRPYVRWLWAKVKPYWMRFGNWCKKLVAPCSSRCTSCLPRKKRDEEGWEDDNDEVSAEPRAPGL